MNNDDREEIWVNGMEKQIQTKHYQNIKAKACLITIYKIKKLQSLKLIKKSMTKVHHLNFARLCATENHVIGRKQTSYPATCWNSPHFVLRLSQPYLYFQEGTDGNHDHNIEITHYSLRIYAPITWMLFTEDLEIRYTKSSTTLIACTMSPLPVVIVISGLSCLLQFCIYSYN